MEQEIVTLSKVKSLVCRGHGNFSVAADGTITCVGTKLQQKGTKLIYESLGGGGGGFTMTGNIAMAGNVMCVGSNCQINTGSVRGGMFMQGGNQVFNNHAGSIISNISTRGGGKSISIVGDQVYINGKLARVDGEDQVAAPTVATPKKPEPRYRLDDSCAIEKVKVEGSFTVSPIPPSFLKLANFNAVVNGSGEIFLPIDCTFKQLSIVLKGSGDISGGTAESATIMLSGSGDVSKVHITKSGSIMLNVSGDVAVTKASAAKVTKMLNGSGDVSIKSLRGCSSTPP